MDSVESPVMGNSLIGEERNIRERKRCDAGIVSDDVPGHGGLRHHHPRSALLRENGRRQSGGIGAVNGGLFPDAADLFADVGENFRCRRQETGAHDRDQRPGAVFLYDGDGRQIVDAVCRKNPRRLPVRRQHARHHGLCGGYHDAGKPEQGHGIGRGGGRARFHIRAGDRRRLFQNEPLVCRFISPEPVLF